MGNIWWYCKINLRAVQLVRMHAFGLRGYRLKSYHADQFFPVTSRFNWFGWVLQKNFGL